MIRLFKKNQNNYLELLSSVNNDRVVPAAADVKPAAALPAATEAADIRRDNMLILFEMPELRLLVSFVPLLSMALSCWLFGVIYIYVKLC